jgi:hypothetical protein
MARLTDPKTRELIEVLSLYYCDNSDRLTIKERGEELPPTPTVYCMLDVKGTIVYIGQTKNLQQRFRQHEAGSPGKAKHWRAVAYFVPGIENLHRRLQVETILICACVPAQNKSVLLTVTKNGHLSEIRYRRSRRR